MKSLLLLAALGAVFPTARAADELPFAGTPKVGANDTVPPPAPVTPTPEQRAAIQAKLAEFKAAIQALRDAKADDDLVVDAEAYGWVVENVLRVPDGFINLAAIGKCTTILDDGLRRAAQIKAGTAAWQKRTGRVNRAYRSTIDGTPQPYHLSIPASYNPAEPTPLYVYLHGRSHDTPDLGLTWVGGSDEGGRRGSASTVQGELGAGGAAAAGAERGGSHYIRVEAFGRGNNSFRWPGETDVFEVIASVRRRYNVDPNRIHLAGFSMGGAGSWQIGLHQPDLFCGLEIDAGVIGNRLSLDDLTPAQRAGSATYGILLPQAVNVFDVPLVAYAGANDAQLSASIAIRQQLGLEGFTIDRTSQYVFTGRNIRTLFLANPGQGHSHATGVTAKLINEFTAADFERGRVVPDHIRFVTYTTRYNRDYWITLDGLEQNFHPARVDAERNATRSAYTISTANLTRLSIADAASAATVSIDGDRLDVAAKPEIVLVRTAGHWTEGPAATGLRKRHNLQGPINDAFFDSFLCVAPTGASDNAAPAAQSRAELARFRAAFARDYCGEARTKEDTAVTADDIAANNLVLFGDPASNRLLARIADHLPIHWTKDAIIVGGKSYAAASHQLVMIYPNPLNPERYVVINSGLSVPARGSPGYGDYAVLNLASPDGPPATSVADEGVFDEHWQLP